MARSWLSTVKVRHNKLAPSDGKWWKVVVCFEASLYQANDLFFILCSDEWITRENVWNFLKQKNVLQMMNVNGFVENSAHPEVAEITQNENLTQINFNYLNPSNSAVACYPLAFCLSDPYQYVPSRCSCSAMILCCSKTLSDVDCLKLYYHESVCCL